MNHPSQAEAGKQAGIRETVDTALLDQAPTSVVIEPDGEIVYIHGRTGKYLELPPGAGVSTNLLRMARDGLRAPLMAAVYQVVTRKEAVVYRDLQAKTDSGMQALDLMVRP